LEKNGIMADAEEKRKIRRAKQGLTEEQVSKMIVLHDGN